MDYIKQNIKPCLPIALEPDGISLDGDCARAIGESLMGDYVFSSPYPHIEIDNFLPLDFIEKILSNFPVESVQGESYYLDGLAGHHKRHILPMQCNSFLNGVFNFFNSAPFLQFLEGITTIDGLIPDPYFNGGGFHELKRGGKLGIHADFRINERLHLNRRVNVIIYLNKEWNKSYGGELEIWDKDLKQKYRSIEPIFNRCIIFNTDADSYHGHPDPLNTPDGITRKSIALYYYTASKGIYEETPATSTKYMSRPGDENRVKIEAFMLRFENYKRDFVPPFFLRCIGKIKKICRDIVGD
jgi:hypothetical protein